MLHLPLDIIEKIIISSDMILTTYNNILILVKTLSFNCKNVSNYDKQNYLSIYKFLSNTVTITNIYKHSGWYTYFIDNIYFTNHQNQLNTILNNYTILKLLLDINIDLDIDINTGEKGITKYREISKTSNYSECINYIELNINYDTIKLLIKRILSYWNLNIKKIDTSLLLIIILSSSALSTEESKKYTLSNTTFKNHLYMTFIKEKIYLDTTIDINIPCYFKPENTIIPLFQKDIGMGYSYNIAWDLSIENYIGFLFGGSSYEDYEYFDTKLKVYLHKNKIERMNYIKKHTKIINKINKINIKLIEILLLDDKPIHYYEKYCINY